jgi:hypothetical protein
VLKYCTPVTDEFFRILPREEIMMRINLNLGKERGLLAGNIFCGLYREKEGDGKQPVDPGKAGTADH